MNATTSSLSALSIDLARAVADAAPAIVYVDAHPRRDASGIVWDDHHIVTVDHAIVREVDIEIVLAGGAKTTAKLVGRDPAIDVAVLRLRDSLAPLRRADAQTLAARNPHIFFETETARDFWKQKLHHFSEIRFVAVYGIRKIRETYASVKFASASTGVTTLIWRIVRPLYVERTLHCHPFRLDFLATSRSRHPSHASPLKRPRLS